MKIEPQHVRFPLPLLPSLAHRTLRLVGGNNSIVLRDTAMVIEGNLKRFSFPVVDLFFNRVLSERTTITVPYSRIEEFTYRAMLGRRIVLTVLFWIPCVLVALPTLVLLVRWRPDAIDWLYLCTLLGLLALVLTLYVHWRLAGRHSLVFRCADGGSTVVSFRIRSRKRREAFADFLERNRETVAQTVPPLLPRPWVSPLSPLLILTGYLLGHHVLFPLWKWLLENNMGPRRGFPAWLVRREQFEPLLASQGNWQNYLIVLGWFLFAFGPVVLLASLLWRWNALVRGLAVLLLLLHAVYPLIGPGVWAMLQPGDAPGLGFGPGGPVMLSFSSAGSFLLHLLLAVWLTLVKGPKSAPVTLPGRG